MHWYILYNISYLKKHIIHKRIQLMSSFDEPSTIDAHSRKYWFSQNRFWTRECEIWKPIIEIHMVFEYIRDCASVLSFIFGLTRIAVHLNFMPLGPTCVPIHQDTDFVLMSFKSGTNFFSKSFCIFTKPMTHIFRTQFNYIRWSTSIIVS